MAGVGHLHGEVRLTSVMVMKTCLGWIVVVVGMALLLDGGNEALSFAGIVAACQRSEAVGVQ